MDAPFAVCATIDPHGRPQMTGVWFVNDEDAIRMSVTDTRKKTRNLQRNPACTVYIVDPQNPLRYLEIRGDAEVIPDDDFEFADRMGVKYNADVRKMTPPDQKRVVLALRPVHVNAVDISR
ncbi:PPOX class F420-dependent oxidoreductase [Streptosporangiaceae bacterium NEAU-GS5]|nr:PPOX class F420-dependent oxidoreductase [Streptosporangiaceae bacterium NEAU-GS5]